MREDGQGCGYGYGVDIYRYLYWAGADSTKEHTFLLFLNTAQDIFL